MKTISKSMKAWTMLALTAVVVMSLPSFALSQDEELSDWPREIHEGVATVVIYQPQLEMFENDKLGARSAVMVKANEDAEPVFGAVWFDARVSTDKETRMVDFLEVKVDAVKFPTLDETQSAQLVDVIEKSFVDSDLSMSLDRLLAEMDMVEQEKSLSEQLNNEPPKILYTDYIAVLVMIDGDPIFDEIEGSKYKYLVNTPFFVVQDPSSKRYFMKGGDYWYTSKDVLSGWQTIDNPPKEVVDLAKDHVEEAPPEDSTAQSEEPDSGEVVEETEPVVPQIVVATEPTELLMSDGAPDYASVEGTELLYMKNTENDIIMDVGSQTYYVLISGRWYAAKSLAGSEWAFIPPDQLPKDFPNIPVGSDMESVLSSVAGTQEARDAALENQIPQTATVDRKSATVEVNYDGNPEFKRIENTNVSYAVNTDKSVLHIDGKYYCCDNAVWFESANSTGPWAVCVSVPDDVQSIPPSEPVYNVKYVYVYDSTPDVVYVGYTPGYYGSYVYGGCVVYGTGYWYHPWYRHYYYPRPVTYGFRVHYNPWTGWGFSFGMSYGWFHVGFGSPYRGWWGPAGYHHGYRHGYRRGYHHGYRRGASAGYAAGYRAGQRQSGSQNMYKKRDGVRHTGDRQRTTTANRKGASTQPAAGAQPRTGTANQKGTQNRSSQQLGGSSGRQNNVYSDKNGNVYRKTDKGWEQNNKSGWSSMDKQQPSSKDKSKSQSQTQRQQQNLNKQHDSRQRGTANTQSYRQGSQSKQRSGSSNRSRSGGGSRKKR